MDLSAIVDDFKRDLRMIEYDVQDRIDEAQLIDLVCGLVEDRHDSDLLFEILLRLPFFVKLGIGPRERDLEIDEPP